MLLVKMDHLNRFNSILQECLYDQVQLESLFLSEWLVFVPCASKRGLSFPQPLPVSFTLFLSAHRAARCAGDSFPWPLVKKGCQLAG